MSTPAEAQLRQRLAELARSYRFSMAREVAVTIAHQINSPLGAVLANVETLQALLQGPAPDLAELRAIAADIQSDSQRAAGVVRHLLNLLERSKVELEVIDLSSPVQDAVDFYATVALSTPLHVSSSMAREPLPVKGNAVLLQHAMINLLTNAMEAMSGVPRDQRRLEIATARVENSADVLIADTGPGIPPDKLDEVFAPFFSTKEQAMGLGLSIVQSIVEAHDGKVWAENRRGGGAAFRITLPLVQG